MWLGLVSGYAAWRREQGLPPPGLKIMAERSLLEGFKLNILISSLHPYCTFDFILGDNNVKKNAHSLSRVFVP